MLSYSRNQEVGSMDVGAGFCMNDVVVKKFTFAISSPDEFLFFICAQLYNFVLTLVFGGRPIITCVFYNVSAQCMECT